MKLLYLKLRVIGPRRTLLAAIVLIANYGAAFAQVDELRQVALEQVGLTIPEQLDCRQPQFDLSQPLRFPINCQDGQYQISINLVDHPTFSVKVLSENLPTSPDWQSMAVLQSQLPLISDFTPDHFYNPSEPSNADAVICLIDTWREEEPYDHKANCLISFLAGSNERVIEVAFDDLGRFTPFGNDTVGPSLLETTIQYNLDRFDLR